MRRLVGCVLTGPLALECRFCKRAYTYLGYLTKHEAECERMHPASFFFFFFSKARMIVGSSSMLTKVWLIMYVVSKLFASPRKRVLRRWDLILNSPPLLNRGPGDLDHMFVCNINDCRVPHRSMRSWRLIVTLFRESMVSDVYIDARTHWKVFSQDSATTDRRTWAHCIDWNSLEMLTGRKRRSKPHAMAQVPAAQSS